MLRRGRIVTGVLVYVLSTTLLIGQQRSLTVPLTSSFSPAPVAGTKVAEPAASGVDAPPRRVARMDTPSGAVGPSATTSLEPDYFSGVASSSYPISVPRGRGGMTPALSLDYRSAAGNGWLGVGWDLQPGSIERQTKSGVDYNADQYLYRTSHASETLVSVGTNLFATEIAARFEKFEKRTAADGHPFWVVTDKGGTVRRYGTTSASRIANPEAPAQIFAWRLDRVVDTLGNATTLTYAADGNHLYLQTIRYAESPGLPAANVITFETEERPDVERSFEIGFEVRITRRLKRIRIAAGGHALPSLAFDYGASPSDATGRSLLRAISIVSADGSTSLPPTQYRYQGARLAVTTPVRPGPAPALTVDKQCLTGDFSGDTYTDMACYTGANGQWQMTLSSATGWTTNSIAGPAPGAEATRQCTTGDLNADGRTDLLCYTTVNGQWHRMLGSPSGWDNSGIIQSSTIGLPIYHQCVTGDMNADGRTDLACWKGGNSWEWTLSRGDVWDPPVAVANGPRVTDVAERCTAADFNADARTDLACFTSNRNLWYIGYSNGTGWLPPVFVPGPPVDVPLGHRCVFGDFNADRRADMSCFVSGHNGDTAWALFLATGTAAGFVQKAFKGPAGYPPIANHCVAMDFNGDTKSDLSCYTTGNRGYHTFTSRGESFHDEGLLPGPSVSSTIPQRCALGDFNGDGKGDLACRGTADWQLMLSGGVTPDLISGTTSIFGGVTSIEYSRAISMPNTRIPFPMDVVTRSTAEDGTGRKAVTTIAYTAGYFDVATRDYRGFRTARITGSVTDGAGGTAVIRYHQGSSIEPGADDPSAEGGYMRGRIDRVRILDRQGVVLRENNFLYGASSGASRFHPLLETTTRACENNVCNEETRAVNTYDRFGNVLRVEDYGDLSRLDDDVTRLTTYAYNEQKYIVSLEATQEVREGVPGGRRLAFAQNFFDGTDTCNTPAPATIPTHGLITRIARWVEDGKPLVEERAAFDEAGNVVCRADPLGNQTTFTFDDTKTFVVSTQNALGHRTSYSYYGVAGQGTDRGLYGLARTVTDPNGAVMTTEWDQFGRQVRALAPLGSVTTWTYSSLGVPLQQNIRTSNTGLTTTVWLDGFGRTVKTRRPGPETKFIVSTARFDERGLPVATSLPYFEGGAPAPDATVVYDSLRRPIEERDASGSRRTICYSSGATDLIDENGHRTRRVISARGRLVQVERYAGVYSRDCAALPLHGTGVVQPYSITQYREDAAGRLTEIIDAKGVITTLAYDGLGRRTRIVDPAFGERNFTFNAAGNETSWRSPSGAAVHVQYDALHRPIQRDYATPKPLGQGDMVHVYDEPGRNGIGRLTSTRNANAARSLTYDIEGRITVTDRTLGGKAYREERRYDTLGRTIEVVYPDGKRITQAYDGPAVRSVFSGSTTYALFSSYNAAGFAEQVRYGNGTVSTSTYETPSNPECPRATYRLCSTKTIGAGGAVVFQAGYGYDARGNVTVVREGSVARSYIYDDFDRLRGVATSSAGFTANAQYRDTVAAAQFPRDWPVLSAPSPQMQLVEGFAYDPADDVAWKWDVGTYEYPPRTAATMNPHAPRKAGENALVWDRDGNLVSGFGRLSAYNVDGRVVSIDVPRSGKQRAIRRGTGAAVHSYQFEYDTDGTRTRESGPRGITTYVGDLAECRSSGGCVNHIFAGSGLVATESPEGAVAYYHRDHQRSVRSMTDRNGSVSARYAYSSYGAPGGTVAIPAFLPTSVLFGSQPYALDAGVYVFGGRAYDPRFGRFLSPDDVVPVAGSPQYLNRYIYAHDNPVSTIDPDGHIVHFLAGLVFGAIVGALTAHFQHADWRQGALFGAISGAFLGLPHDFGLTGTALRAATMVSGFASGGINAAIGGGDVGRGIFAGGLTSLAGSLAGYGEEKALGFWMERPKSVLLSTAKHVARSAAHGAVYGGLHAISTGDNILSGALHGARGQVLGTLGNMAVGHTLGFVGSAISSHTPFPIIDQGQFVYKTTIYSAISKGLITFGNVTLNSSPHSASAGWGWIRWREHEMAHTNWQDPLLGPAYIPAHAWSLTLGTAIGLIQEQNWSGHHPYGALENFVMGDQGYARTHR